MASEQYGMTPQGFIPKRLADILDSINTRMSDITDPATGEKPFLNAEDDAILSQVVGVFANELGEAWAEAAKAAVQFDPLYNSGEGQSGTVQLNGIVRKPGSKSIIAVMLTGTPGVVVEKGKKIGPLSGDTEWEINSNLIFPQPSAGETETTVNGYATCADYGPINPDPGEINAILTPVSGWFGVTNLSTESIGTAEETDESLRERQQQSTSETSYRQIDAIRAAILNVEGVTFCRVYQNSKTFPADARGIPFKEVAAVVVGGDPEEIARAMAIRLPTAQLGYGNVPIELTDSQGIAYPYSFSRPAEVPVYVDVVVKITNPAEFPSGSAIENIQENILSYVASMKEGEGFPPGEEVVRTRLYTPINAVPGHEIVSVKIGTTADNLAEENIAIAWNQASAFDASRITVTVQS